MTEKVYEPSAYFTNIVKVAILFIQQGNRPLTARNIAEKLNLSHNYIFQTTKTMKVLKLLENHAEFYVLTSNGLLFAEYLQKKDIEELKKLGEKILHNDTDKNEKNFALLRKAINKLTSEPNITDFDLGTYLASEFNLKWDTAGTYQRIGGSCKSILNGFNLIGAQKETQLELKYDAEYNINSIEKLAYLHKDINTFIHMVSEDTNAWKNHIELKQRIEKHFDELINNQYVTASQLLLQESKKWFKEGCNRKDVDLIRHSLSSLIKIEINKLLK